MAPVRKACRVRSRISRRRPAWRCRRGVAARLAQAAKRGHAGRDRHAPPDNTSKQATRNYEIDRTVAYTRQPAGRLKRLTVAVLVDNLRATDDEGKVTETALTPEQIENMTRLVKDAVGFDQARGDSVNVVNASFKGELAAGRRRSRTRSRCGSGRWCATSPSCSPA